MRLHFDVLHEPCIQVERLSGETDILGIADVLRQAHLLRTIRGDTPVEEYALHRLLIAFISDLYRPRSARDIGTLVKQGCFQPKDVDAYEAACRAEGVTFDLFDESRPFLQTPGLAGPVVEAGRLFLQIPSGNNHVFMTHLDRIRRSFSPMECLAGLATLAPYAIMLGRSTHYSAVGVPPVYFLYAGGNLFETLAVSMVHARAYPDESLYAQPPVSWRDPMPVPAGGPPPGVSYLSGLTAQPRRVRLLPQMEDGRIVVREMAFDKGYVYKQAVYQDPHALYVQKEDELRSLKAQESRAVWRDVGAMTAPQNRLALRGNLKDKLPEEPAVVPLRAYALVSRQKGATRAPIAWWREELPLRASLLSDDRPAQVYDECLKDLETIARMLMNVMQKTTGQLQGKKIQAGKTKGGYGCFSQEVGALFLEESRRFALEELPGKLENAEDALAVRRDTVFNMAKRAVCILDSFMDRFPPSSERLEWQARACGALSAMTYKYRKDKELLQEVKPDGDDTEEKAGDKGADHGVSRPRAEADEGRTHSAQARARQGGR